MLGDTLATIKESDFERFRRMKIRDFPETWSAWLILLEAAKLRLPNAATHDISPDAFEEWFRTTGRDVASLDDLGRFAEESRAPSGPLFAHSTYDPLE